MRPGAAPVFPVVTPCPPQLSKQQGATPVPVAARVSKTAAQDRRAGGRLAQPPSRERGWAWARTRLPSPARRLCVSPLCHCDNLPQTPARCLGHKSARVEL